MQKQSLWQNSAHIPPLQTTLDTGLISMQICVSLIGNSNCFFYNVPQIVLLKHCI